MNSSLWQELKAIEDIAEVFKQSEQFPCLVFKHSTRCSISIAAKRRLEAVSNELLQEFKCFYVDVLANRDVSNEIARATNVVHESPQAIIVYNGKAVGSLSHRDISLPALQEILAENTAK